MSDRHVIRQVAGGAAHVPPECAADGQDWPCETLRDQAVMAAIEDELWRAMSQHGPMKSDREGHSVIEEEYDEFRLAVFYGIDQRGQPADAHEEARQLGAMAARFLLDVPEASE